MPTKVPLILQHSPFYPFLVDNLISAVRFPRFILAWFYWGLTCFHQCLEDFSLHSLLSFVNMLKYGYGVLFLQASEISSQIAVLLPVRFIWNVFVIFLNKNIGINGEESIYIILNVF